MRTLPLRLAAVEGESLAGYISRYAHTFAMQPGDVVRCLGICDGPVNTKDTGRYALSLSSGQLERAAHASGLEPAVVEGMLLARFAGRAFECEDPSRLGETPGTAFQREVRILRSRYCPGCLLEHGTWMVVWQLAWSVACVRHQTLLVARCEGCGEPPRIPLRERWPSDQDGELRDPACCFARLSRHGDLCRCQYLHTLAPAASEALLGAQTRIDEILHGRREPLLAGEPHRPHAYLRDLLALASLLRRCREEPARAGRVLLDDPATLASVLPDAITLADLPSRSALAAELSHLGEVRYRVSTKKLPSAHELHSMSEALREALGRARNQSSWARPTLKLGIDPNAYRRPEDLHPALEARHVPQLLWQAAYTPDLAEHLEFLKGEDHARRFCSALLVCMLSPVGFFGAVRYLELPELFLHAEYVKAFSRLRNLGRLEDLASTLKQNANGQAGQLIDYAQRRENLRHWAGIDHDTWMALQPRGNWAPDKEPLRAHASLWLWCQLTGGCERAAPTTLAPPDLRDHAAASASFPPRLRKGLLKHGQKLIATPKASRTVN